MPPPLGTRNSEFWLTLLAAELGSLFAHADICDGQLFHHIAPKPGEERQPTGECSTARLRMHTDGASHPLPPDLILIWCHRGRPHIRTAVASVEAALAHLSPSEVELLGECTFRHHLDYEFGLRNNLQTFGPHPIIMDEGAVVSARVDFDFLCSPDPSQRRALEHLEAALEAAAAQVALQAGDLFVFDNRRTVHARDAFVPSFDGSDRWLQCAYVRRDTTAIPSGVSIRHRVAYMSA